MELTIAMRIRIAVVCLIGAVIIGIGAFGFVQPETPLDALTMLNGNISVMDAVICAVLAFITGVVSYFAAYPYGKQIAGLAVPVGLGVWAFRSGTMASLMLVNRSVELREQIYTEFQLEIILWLAIIAAGFAGVYAAKTFTGLKDAQPPEDIGKKFHKNQAVNIAIAVVISVIITHFMIAILAQNVKMFDSAKNIEQVIGQPSAGQIAFAVLVSFGLAAFVAKYYFSVSYFYVIAASVLLTVWTARFCANSAVLEHMADNWPAHFFARSSCAILPFQLVSFAAIGSIAGYWFAVQWAHSKENSLESEK